MPWESAYWLQSRLSAKDTPFVNEDPSLDEKRWFQSGIPTELGHSGKGNRRISMVQIYRGRVAAR